jgi:hypothetical protein
MLVPARIASRGKEAAVNSLLLDPNLYLSARERYRALAEVDGLTAVVVFRV